MERLKYVLEDETIAEILGRQNFTSEESAMLELVKNSYDAKATKLTIEFNNDKIILIDNGIGMNEENIKNNWMYIGKSEKGYKIKDVNNNDRILAGSKGVGRFALSRLGKEIIVNSKKEDCLGVTWHTNWRETSFDINSSLNQKGTEIIISGLREKWSSKKIKNLLNFLSITYNNNLMKIIIKYKNDNIEVTPYIQNVKIGENCITQINLNYNCKTCMLETNIISDEFLDEAQNCYKDGNIKQHFSSIYMVNELKNNNDIDVTDDELDVILKKLGNFSSELCFVKSNIKKDIKRFLYKDHTIKKNDKIGITLYRNAFSIASYEGYKDWLGLGKRSRKSPASATHMTGAWRVRENQIFGKVNIDKKENQELKDLSNRQGLEENVYYKLFVEIILTGIKEFERYRQRIIRSIVNASKEDNKNNESKQSKLLDEFVNNPNIVKKLNENDLQNLSHEIKQERETLDYYKFEKKEIENQYKYDVKILNVLATIGLKASSKAHEMRNDKNKIEYNVGLIIKALKKYELWEELSSPEKTKRAYKNVPGLLTDMTRVSKKLTNFMDIMLQEIEKKQFIEQPQSIYDILEKVQTIWTKEYDLLTINIDMEDDICIKISEDSIRVIFDNLILNSIQQNSNKHDLNITIKASLKSNGVEFIYEDNGKGLDDKYKNDPKKILEVHETTRENGHGLGMWIVNNTIVSYSGEIFDICGQNGFKINFLLKER